MSAGFRWEPITSNDERQFGAYCPSRLIEAFKEVFGDPPWELNSGAIPIIEALKVAGLADDAEEFVNVLREYGHVRFHVVY